MSGRPPNALKREIQNILTASGQPMTVAAVYAEVLKNGQTSSGAVSQSLKRLVADGDAVNLGGKPLLFAIDTTNQAPQAAPAPAPAPAPTSGRRRRVAPVARPNGTSYFPRDLHGRPDVEVLQDLRAAGIPVLLQGPPGTGKTALAEASFPDLVTVAGDGDTCVGDLVGEYTQETDGTFVFHYGPLVRAMREGRALLIDDATLIAPPVLATLYPAMDGRGEIAIKAHKNETVTAAEGFYVLAGHNPFVHGAVLTEALASRFGIHIDIHTDYDLAAQLGVPTAAITIAKALSKKHTEGKVTWAPQMRELIAFRDTARLMGERFALHNLVGIAPEADRTQVAQAVSAVAGTRARPLTLGVQLTTTTAPAPPAPAQPSPAGTATAPTPAPPQSQSQPQPQPQPQPNGAST
ncbi:AAA family ATPase [Glycomyces sp. NPDC047369]